MRLVKKMNIIQASRNDDYCLANSPPRRHCEAKEKIPVEKKVHLPKQSHS